MNEPSGLIFQLMPKVMADIGAVTKTRKNQQQGYQFRGIDEIYNAVQPALLKHGVFVVPEVKEQSREERQTKNGGTLLYTILKVAHHFYAPDGSHVDCITVGEAMDSGDKSANKAMSAAMKYALIETFCIPTEEPIDTENETHELAAPEKKAPPADPVKAYRSALNSAFKARGFTQDESKQVVTAALSAWGVDNVSALNEERRTSLLASVTDGRCDKYKTKGKPVEAAV